MDKSKETERQKIILDIIEYLGKEYPHWTINDLKIVSANLFKNFYQFQKTRGITIQEIVSEGCFKLDKRHPKPGISIGYWLNKDFQKELKRIYSDKKNFEELKDEENQLIERELFSDFDDSMKITLYAHEIKKKNELTPKETELFDLLIDLSLADLDDNVYKYLNKVALELGLTNKDTTFRKTYQRLREKLLNPTNKGSLNRLTYTTNEKDSVLADFFRYIDSHFFKINNLQAYRFSEQEMHKMIALKKIFGENKYNIDRFPEVYIDENYVIDEKDFLYLDIDKLGCYEYTSNEDNTTEEGFIIIYSSAIEMYCKAIKIKSDDVKFVVLMHELGHWLTHWSYKDNSNWANGYKADIHNKTHESLAQLIAFWAVTGIPELEDTLYKLTPKNLKSPYSLYVNLKDFSQYNILRKLYIIRSFKDKNDDEMYNVLSMDEKKFNEIYEGHFVGTRFGI